MLKMVKKEGIRQSLTKLKERVIKVKCTAFADAAFLTNDREKAFK